MAKILVADDNSNVQKTVALALADLGVEVVAVNNGEAAVRKLADVTPDLVLADIFMPVRNGYEVCEFVKKDARFSHLPVVLLVGAFDPLDEREAQRVGADGILKKPFVPPDPLISMVKMLLDRTLGEHLVGVAASKPAAAMRGKAGGVATVEEPPAPAISSPASAVQTTQEIAEDELLRPVERVSFGEGERPMAFGRLLDLPEEASAAGGAGAIEPVENEQILTSSRDASLGDPIFWKTEEPETENQEETSDADRDITAAPPMRAWKPDEEARARQAEADFLQPVEPFELVREDPAESSASAPTIVEPSAIIAQDAASQASLNVEASKLEDLAANPIEWMASVPPPPAEEIPEPPQEWGAAVTEPPDHLVQDGADTMPSVPRASGPDLPAENAAPELPVQPQDAASAGIPDPLKTQPSLDPLARTEEKAAFSISKQDWADLAEKIHPKDVGRNEEKPMVASSAPVPTAETPSSADVAPAFANLASPVLKSSDQSAEDTARSLPKRDWADLTANLAPKSTETAAEKTPAAPGAESAAPPAAKIPAISTDVSQKAGTNVAIAQPAGPDSAPPSPDPVLVEAVVQRILEKMRPQVVDIITKEFLRPIVQALVHREIQKH